MRHRERAGWLTETTGQLCIMERGPITITTFEMGYPNLLHLAMQQPPPPPIIDVSPLLWEIAFFFVCSCSHLFLSLPSLSLFRKTEPMISITIAGRIDHRGEGKGILSSWRRLSGAGLLYSIESVDMFLGNTRLIPLVQQPRGCCGGRKGSVGVV